MQKINFFKVLTLPTAGNWVANSFYYMENASYAEAYLVDDAGVPKSVGNSDMINAIITTRLSSISSLQVVADIAARNALTLTVATMVMVKDASADATVDAGAALYVFEPGPDTYTKIAEYESLDLAVAWNNITGKPSSTPANIDAAVAASHTHANAANLNKIGQDSDGDMTYDSKPISHWNVTNW